MYIILSLSSLLAPRSFVLLLSRPPLGTISGGVGGGAAIILPPHRFEIMIPSFLPSTPNGPYLVAVENVTIYHHPLPPSSPSACSLMIAIWLPLAVPQPHPRRSSPGATLHLKKQEPAASPRYPLEGGG